MSLFPGARTGRPRGRPFLLCEVRNYIDHTLTDQSSVLKFVEDNWLAGQRIEPGGSFDTIAGSINGMFSF